VALAEGLKENDPFPTPIITPTTKADNGEHDEDISREAILSKELFLKRIMRFSKNTPALCMNVGRKLQNPAG
jgi:phosphoribosylaminoimidazole-succinocarboxamide synthase